MKRVILMILDSVGVGELPDAHLYGDVGSNTLGDIKKQVTDLELPNLESLGLGHLLEGFKKKESVGAYGKMAEASVGKDTTTGHWEIAGLFVDEPFPTYPDGFPADLIAAFEEKVGRKVIGNIPASGTEIIEKLGDAHVKTGDLIVYTSADSVFQIAAHEDVVSLDELYKICQIAKEMLVGKWNVSRVIARPFVGESGNYTRTANRRDYSVSPPTPTMLDYLTQAGIQTTGVGKISDIYNGQGISASHPTKDNEAGVDKTLALMRTQADGLIFTNLVDFDALFGHRRDPVGYAKALEEFDGRLPELMEALREDDLLILTADHGCDPTFKGTDHTREYVPIFVVGKSVRAGADLGVRPTFADVGKTILDYFGVEGEIEGTSFLGEL